MNASDRNRILELIDAEENDLRENGIHWAYAAAMISFLESVREHVLAGRNEESRTLMLAIQRANREVRQFSDSAS
jgi:hypothetical protein